MYSWKPAYGESRSVGTKAMAINDVHIQHTKEKDR